VAYPPIPAWLDEMPLDSPEHVRHAWHMIGHPMIRGRLRQFDGLSPGECAAVVEAMRRRIRKAAWDYDLVLFGGPLPDRYAPRRGVSAPR
jgi:hypothetical protein